jgi:hypothetical protein
LPSGVGSTLSWSSRFLVEFVGNDQANVAGYFPFPVEIKGRQKPPHVAITRD